jgi:hypothetical protein
MLSLPGSQANTDWEDLSFKLQLEKTLVQESRAIVEAVLPKTHYFIVLSVTLEAQPQVKAAPTVASGELTKVFSEAELKALAQNNDRIFLDKLGGWTMPAAQAPPAAAATAQTKQRNVSKIDVTLGYDETLDVRKVEAVKKTLEFMYAGYTKKINLQLEKQQIFVAPEKEIVQLTTKDWVQLLKEPLTYLIIALMGLLGYLSTNKKLINVEKEKVAAMNASAQAAAQTQDIPEPQQQTRAAEAQAVSPTASAAASTPSPGQDSKIKELVSKIENICATNMHDLKSLVKEFLAEESIAADCALTFLANSLNVETLKKLTVLLEPAERTKWKKALITNFDLDKISIAQLHLGKSISQFYLEDSDTSGKEVREMMKLLSPRDAAQVLQKNTKLAAFLFNNLSSVQLTRVVALLEADVLTAALKESMMYSESENANIVSTLKTELQEVKSKNDNLVNPFVEKSFDLIKDVPVAKEEAIFTAIATTGQEEVLGKMAIENFPASLMLELPTSFLATALNRFKLDRRVEIILSREEADKNKLLASYGETGKNREIIDLEIQTVTLNQLKMKSIQKNKDVLWSEFVKGVRTYYRSLAEEPTEIEEIRVRWVKDYIAKNRGSDVSSKAS